MAGKKIDLTKEACALLLVDIQPDFLPGGALAVEQGKEILKPVSTLLESGRFRDYVATQDWHPPGHISFVTSHPGHKPNDTIDLNGHEQRLWPEHCVQGTPGAELTPELDWKPVSAIIRKGTDPDADSYSAFRNNWNLEGERPPTGLSGYLRNRGIEKVFVCGLARDVCAQWTAEDAADEGFGTFFLWEATRPVDRDSDDRVRERLQSKGVEIVSLEDLGL